MSTEDGEHSNEGGGKRKTEELFVEYYDFMFATARKILKQKADAEDVVQSLYFKLLESEIPPDVWENPRGYLYRTVVNTCFNWKSASKSKKENQGVEKLELTEPRSGHAHENAANQVEHLLDSLDEDTVKIVMLHADSGYSDAEIAVMVGGSRSKITMIMTRAREKLRKIQRGPDTRGKEKHAGT